MISTLMEDIIVGRVMSASVHTVTPDTLVEDAATKMLSNDIGSLVVVDGNNGLQGILTTTDFVEIVSKSRPKAETTVSRYMTTDVVTTSVQDSIQDVAETMSRCGFHHLPVVDETEGVIGMVTTADLANYISTVGAPETF